MKNQFKRIITIFMFFVVALSLNFSAAAVVEVPEKVRIGLLYNDSYTKTAAESFTVNAQKGIQLGCLKGKNFISLYETTTNDVITIRKDSYFVRTNNSLKEYSPASPVVPDGEKLGPFHVQIGEGYTSPDSARKTADELKAKGIDTYIAYADAWYVWAGFFTDEASAVSFALENIIPVAGEITCTTIKPSANSIVASDANGQTLIVFADTSGVLQIHPGKENDPFIFTLNGRSNYRGILEVRRLTGSDMTVINILPIDHYLYGVVPAEIGPDSHPEALKAQAVAARTYTLANLNRHQNLQFDLCPTVACQVYKGKDREDPRSNKAVDDTSGKKIVYNGNLAQVFYFSSSGGRTEDSKNVWGGDIPYLKSVEDKYESGDSWHYNWEVTLTSEKIKERMQQLGNNIGDIAGVTVTKVSETGRAIELVVQGTSGKAVFLREKTRTVFSLDSQLYKITTDADISIKGIGGQSENIQFSEKKVITSGGLKTLGKLGKPVVVIGAGGIKNEIPVAPTTYKFTGKGWGHAVGMSQEGAKGMANAGFTYEEILKHYFTGVEIE